ncbi:peroxide stress protein YaaA [Nonomuraea sp. MCN248]|uniref:Peroxide stress protein YaaA n=1 Tax=Nonomuraea corallina TaxID=2989783 RepID=A0ABT4S698_9ACTN|nr:peroxide stress protein YaaA [Nonomuraea corallina]MDA0632460.1 peroxide stress protein YaaA [Nonomuraea corallina]
MLIVLPPSEGKAPAGDGPPVAGLSFPKLDRPRKRVLNALIRASRRRDALDVLGLSPGQAPELAKNLELRTAGTLPAADLYTGVLYDNLAPGELSPEARARAEESVLIFSGLWGVVRLSDRIPPYRLAMGVSLPPVGPLAAFWRPFLTPELDRLPGLVVDLRSSAYASAWRPGPRGVSVRVLKAGKVVSHMAKATRGEVARRLLESGLTPETPDELVKTLDDLGYRVTLTGGRLDVHLP